MIFILYVVCPRDAQYNSVSRLRPRRLQLRGGRGGGRAARGCPQLLAARRRPRPRPRDLGAAAGAHGRIKTRGRNQRETSFYNVDRLDAYRSCYIRSYADSHRAPRDETKHAPRSLTVSGGRLRAPHGRPAHRSRGARVGELALGRRWRSATAHGRPAHRSRGARVGELALGRRWRSATDGRRAAHEGLAAPLALARQRALHCFFCFFFFG